MSDYIVIWSGAHKTSLPGIGGIERRGNYLTEKATLQQIAIALGLPQEAADVSSSDSLVQHAATVHEALVVTQRALEAERSRVARLKDTLQAKSQAWAEQLIRAEKAEAALPAPPPEKALQERARTLIARIGVPQAYSMEGPPPEDGETYSLCCDDPAGEGHEHACFGTVIARDLNTARRVAEDIAEAFAILGEFAR